MSKTNLIARAVIGPFQKAARWFARGVNPFVRVGDILLVGAKDKLCSQDNPDAEAVLFPSAANDSVDNTKDIEMFRCLMDLVPSFDAILDELLVDAPQIVPLSKYLTEQGQQKRQADSNEIKTDIFEYLDKPPAPEIRAGLKAVTRGFNHPLFAALLVPRKKLDIFNQDPERFMNKVKIMDIRITSLDFPTFLYDEGTDYDPENIEKGLLRGKLLVRVYRHIFTGPSTALLGQVHVSNARPTKGQYYRRSGCDAPTIAYAAVQTYFALSAAPQWKPQTCGYDFVAFYNQIIKLLSRRDLDDPTKPDAWVEETLEWWNDKVGIYREPDQTRESGTDTQTDSGDDPMDVIESQRRRRHAAALELENATNDTSNIDPQLLGHDESVTANHPKSPLGDQNQSRDNITTEDASVHPPSSPLSDLDMNCEDTGAALSPVQNHGTNLNGHGGQRKRPAGESEGSHKVTKKPKAAKRRVTRAQNK